MTALSQIGQISLTVSSAERAIAFYRDGLGLRLLYRFGSLCFFDCAGVRLFIAESTDEGKIAAASCIYFRCADMQHTVKSLAERGVKFDDDPHLIAEMPDHDLWMVFFKDPDGHDLALMQEAPKGYRPR